MQLYLNANFLWKANLKLSLLAGLVLCLASGLINAQSVDQTKGDFEDKFRQLDEVLPTPNIYRNAAGEPGHEYWQQQVDYEIDITLDEELKRLSGSMSIDYQNNSPDTLRYLWLQLDQNIFRDDSMSELTNPFAGIGRRGPSTSLPSGGDAAGLSIAELRRQQFMEDNVLGYDIQRVESGGDALDYVIVGTNMRIDLAEPLRSGASVNFEIDYAYNIVEEDAVWARAGYENFPDDAREGGNQIFLLAQWYPRLHSYTDYEAWTNKPFLGRGEFTLEFGDYEVDITVPADHIVSSTGELANANQVLTSTQRQRLREAEDADQPVFIVTREEALENEAEGSDDTKTWRFEAENVRDFAWASSRKFIWDAQGYQQGGDVQPLVMAMSFYPKEGEPLWSLYSTASVIHTMEVYSRFSFDYPYPTAQSVNGPVGGMEYPMITFNGPRTEPPPEKEDEEGDETAEGEAADGPAELTADDLDLRTYSLAEKRFLVGVIIHEIGHIYYPMIVNTDERQWTWMDEGINSFLDGVASREWDPDIPWGVEPRDITGYMQSSNQVPIMTQSDSVWNLGPNAYTKPAVALNILREVVLGRELFDFAFKEYSRRWAFKRPTPSDFFRTMEEASGVDLDWFWRGWFYSTDHVDISLDRIYRLRMDTEDPDIDFERSRQEVKEEPISLFVERNREAGMIPWVDRNPDISDYYDENDQFTVTNKERNGYQSFLEGLEDWEREAFLRAVEEDKNYYIMEFSNIGGLVMPILLEMTFTDGSVEEINIPAEIWRRTPDQVHKLFVFDKVLESVAVDPQWETADVDVENNYYPRRIIPSRIEAYQSQDRSGFVYRDIIADSQTELDEADDEESEDGEE